MRVLNLFSASLRWLGVGAFVTAAGLAVTTVRADSPSGDSDSSQRDRANASRTDEDPQSSDSSDSQNRTRRQARLDARNRQNQNQNASGDQSSDPNRRSANFRSDRDLNNTDRNVREDSVQRANRIENAQNRSDRRDGRPFNASPNDVNAWQAGQSQGQFQGQNHRQRFGVIWADDDDHWMVEEVTRGGVAARAGLRPDDEVISLNGRQIGSSRDFQRYLNSRERVPLVVVRDGRRMTIWLGGNMPGYSQQYAQNQYQQNQYQQSFSHDAGQSADAHAFLGVQLNDQYQNMAVVKQVFQNSPAQQAGLQPGDTITAVNGQRVASPQELTDEVQQLQPGDAVQIQFSRPQARTVQLRLGGRSDASQASYQSSEQRRGDRREGSQNQDSSQSSDESDDDSHSKSHDSGEQRGDD